MREYTMISQAKDRIIFAMDVAHFEDAQRFVRLLRDRVGIFKVGKQLFTHAGPKVLDMIRQHGQRTFLDLKFHDIPNTVGKASQEATKLEVTMFDVHVLGGVDMMKAAVQATREKAKELGTQRPLLLGVTVLTSLDNESLRQIGIKDSVEEEVSRLARLAEEAGLDGVVASPQEIEIIRKTCGHDFIVVTPGVRPAEAAKDDQRRVMTPAEAIKAGADYLVIGRPIQHARDPVEAVDRIAGEIQTV
jgi:orotidine-5'-phosphate decarboxylase